MRISRFQSGAAITVVLIGVVVGVVAVLAAEQVDHYTSTDAFCGTTCHSMEAYIANDETFLSSAHRTAIHGVRAGCADCHISKAGLVAATWDHIKGGAKDTYAELMNDFQDPRVWEERRAALAYAVRDKMLSDDSANCRFCHQEDAIEPSRKRGQSLHAEAREEGITCIACHYNLVHTPVEPRESFLRESGG
jgi:nitrate/TMAO reductase-like tetraheme cytochrome c subunit